MDWVERELADHLIEMYWKKGKSLTQISKDFGVPVSTLWNQFNEFYVPRRSIKKAMKLKWKERKVAQKSEQNLKENSLKN